MLRINSLNYEYLFYYCLDLILFRKKQSYCYLYIYLFIYLLYYNILLSSFKYI